VPDNVDRLFPIRTIAEQLDVPLGQMQNWAHASNNGFPQVAKRIGRYTLYDIDEVRDWLVLWKRVTVGQGRGEELNSGKRTSKRRRSN